MRAKANSKHAKHVVERVLLMRVLLYGARSRLITRLKIVTDYTKLDTTVRCFGGCIICLPVCV